MGDPVTLALTVASTAVSVMGKMSEAEGQAASLRAQQQEQNYSAALQRMNADAVSGEYAAKENGLRAQQAQALGRQRAALAESGIGIDSGTATDLLQQDTINSRLDDLTLRYEGQTKRNDLLNNASLQTYDGKVDAMKASQAMREGELGALGDVLGGATRYYGSSDLNPRGAYGAGYTNTSAGRIDWFPAPRSY